MVTPKCSDELKTVYDKICKKSYNFDCDNPKFTSRGTGTSYDPHSPPVTGRTRLQRGRGLRNNTWFQNVNGSPNRDLDTPNHLHKFKIHNAVGSDLSGHRYKRQTLKVAQEEDLETFKCKKTPTEICHDRPLRVKTQKCEERKEHKCERVSSTNPRLIKRPLCRNVPYNECDMENQYEMTMVQVPRYTEECKKVPREICDNYGTSTLEVKCVNETKPICEWKAANPACLKTPRQHCYKIPYQVMTNYCDQTFNEDNLTQP